MSAQDNLSPQQFYHGTASELRPGSYIRPAVQTGLPGNFPGLSNPEYAHATTSMGSAATYAERAADWTYSRGGKHTGRVYEVSPPANIENDPEDRSGGAYRSKEPWRVKRRVPASEWRPDY